MKDVKKIAASKRRRILIIASVVLIVILAIAIAYVMEYVRTTIYEDPADGAKYYIRLEDGEYKIYYPNKKDVLPLTDDGEYYVTEAGTLVHLDATTGEYFTMAVVDENYNEVSVNSSSILALPYYASERIRSVEVHNQNGSFTMHRYNYAEDRLDDTMDFTIKGFPLVSVDQIGISSLNVSAGRLLANRKFVSPDALTDEQRADPAEVERLTYVTEEDGTLDESEYGLVAETRQKIDEETGELVDYEYTPAYFIVTTTADEQGKSIKYKVIIGDELVTGEGYYTQIVEYTAEGQKVRDVVYISPISLGVSMLADVSKFAVATLSYPMSITTYLNVTNFHIFEGENETPAVAFSFIPLEDREDTAFSGNAYRFHESLEGYAPATTVIAQCLEGIYQPSLVGIKALFNAVTDMGPLVEYGFYTESVDEKGEKTYDISCDYMIVFDYNSEDYGVIRQNIMIMKADNGNYYAYTMVHDPKTNEFIYSYNMIVEVSAYSFYFLEMEPHHWVEHRFFVTGITFVDRVKVEAPGYKSEIVLDNSASDPSEPLDSSMLVLRGTEQYADGTTNTVRTLAELRLMDKNNILWQITEKNVRAFDSNYEEITINESSWYETTNLLGAKVKALNGYIECYDVNGAEKIVRVSANEVTVKDVKTQTTVTYARCATTQFRMFYKNFMLNHIESSYEMTAEQEAALIENEENWICTVTMRIDGEDYEYAFYYLSPRKAYLTINGNGGFYVHIDNADKPLEDIQNFFSGKVVEAVEQ
ncbi:MAG: hypothetical protein IKL59_08360 [Clostridia bacterium]|nr:hypothetical protein [Clostridia bacterium]